MGALIGYARVSTLEQSPELQRDALLAAGCFRVYVDHASGRLDARPQLAAALDALRPEDTLVVWRLDRLGRSLSHLLETVTGLSERGVGFRSLTESIDTTTPAGRLVFHVFGALAEFEAALVRERTLAGLAAARARGRKGGRPLSMTAEKLAVARQMHASRQHTVAEIARVLGVSRATVHRHLAASADRPTPAPAGPPTPPPRPAAGPEATASGASATGAGAPVVSGPARTEPAPLPPARPEPSPRTRAPRGTGSPVGAMSRRPGRPTTGPSAAAGQAAQRPAPADEAPAPGDGAGAAETRGSGRRRRPTTAAGMAELVSVQRAPDFDVTRRWRVLVDGEQVGSVGPAPGRGRRWQAFGRGPTGSRETFPTRDQAVARVLDNEERRQAARRGRPGSWWYLVDADAVDENAPVWVRSRHRSQQTARDALARAAARGTEPGRVLEVRPRHAIAAWLEPTPDGPPVRHDGPPPP